jgi:hypothetical protein
MTDSTAKLTKQEQNWMLMTILQIPWHHANRIEDESDREFLLGKAEEALHHMQLQQQMSKQEAVRGHEAEDDKECCGAKDS